MGMPFFENSRKFGNLNITFNIEFPRAPDENEKEAYEILLKSQAKKQVKKDNITNTHFMIDFNPYTVNTSERGGKAHNVEEEEDNTGQDGQKVNCQNQ